MYPHKFLSHILHSTPSPVLIVLHTVTGISSIMLSVCKRAGDSRGLFIFMDKKAFKNL